MSTVINPEDETIWAYKLPTGEICVTPDWDWASTRGVSNPTLIHHRPNDE